MSVSAESAKNVGQTTVEVGRVFGEGGTDGLILYALILATFLMFLATVMFAMLLRRSLDSQDRQSAAFGVASEKSAEALRELATALAHASAQDQTHQLAVSHTLGQIQSYIGQHGGPNRPGGPT